MKAIYIIHDRSEGMDSIHEAHVIANDPKIALIKAKALLGATDELVIMRAIEWEATINRSESSMSADMNMEHGDMHDD